MGEVVKVTDIHKLACHKRQGRAFGLVTTIVHPDSNGFFDLTSSSSLSSGNKGG